MWICIAHRREHTSSALRLPYVGADLRLTNRQLDTILHCETADTG